VHLDGRHERRHRRRAAVGLEFHSVDHLGSVFLMGLVPGQPLPFAVVRPGQTVTFHLRAYELVGEGVMQWAPDLHHVVADWDYTVEND
jgi:hypothetical protein